MKKKLLCMFTALSMVLCFTGCLDYFPDDSSSSSSSSYGSDSSKTLGINEAATPRSAWKSEGKNYKDIVKEFKEAGFTNIETKALEDMIIGLLVSEDEVKTISIDGKDDFDEGDVFKKNAKIVISYHSYPAKDSEKDSGSEKETEKETTTTKGETTSETTTQATTDYKNTVLTIQNNKDLAQILTTNCDPSLYRAFADKYYGCIIEFDGNIAYMDHYSDSKRTYKTRYNFLIYAGNYNADVGNPGVHMQIRNENFNGLHMKGADEARMGMNIHIKAKIGEFSKGELLYIDPIETTVR